MFQRLLSMLGFGYYLPTSSELGLSGSNAPETDGQAEVSFVAGKRTQIEAETEETLDERRKNLTDDALVWPGKTDALNYENDEPVDYRVSLTVTDLEPSYYMRRPAIGGQWQPDQSVLLRPGEQTKFEVIFTPPVNTDKNALRNFSYVLTRFDPRRANDSGEVLGDVPMRWVPLPKPADLKIGVNPPVVITRPWRRAALFNLEFLNRSQLPPSVSLKVQRGENKAKLDEEPEQVATVSQSLPSRTPGVWRLLIPPPAARGSYFTTVVGEAKVADGKEYPLRLEKPIFVRYIPWLRAAKDWVFLLGGLFLLLLIVFGFPVYKAPVVFFNPAVSPPDGGAESDISFTGVSEEDVEHAFPAKPAPGGGYQVTLPARLYGFRPFFGWGDPEPYKFHIAVKSPADNPLYQGFPKTLVKANNGIQEAKISGTPLFGAWKMNVEPVTLEVPPKAGEPHITGFAPAKLKPGKSQEIVLRGENFGPPEKAGKVVFKQSDGETDGEVVEWSKEKITVLSPETLPTAETKFYIVVKPKGAAAASNQLAIFVTNGQSPAIAGAPAGAPAGAVAGPGSPPAGAAPGAASGSTAGAAPHKNTGTAAHHDNSSHPQHNNNQQPLPVSDHKQEMLDAFRDFFIADYVSHTASEDAKAKANAVIAKANAYQKQSGNTALSSGLRAMAYYRLDNPDQYKTELAAAEGDPLLHELAADLEKYHMGKWDNTGDIAHLKQLADGPGELLVKDCAYKLCMNGYDENGDSGLVDIVQKKISDSAIAALKSP